MPDTPLLELRDLSIQFRTGRGDVQVTHRTSFSVGRGEMVGLVGESGCGKTVTGLAIMGLLPRASTRLEGRILLEGQDLVSLPERAMRRLRGRRISMIFQEPMSALDPVFTIGQQITETLRSHHAISQAEARNRAIEALARVGIPEPALRYDAYPHQLSGGMRQRAMIAIALVCEPQILIADEPTTALDVTVQAQIVDVLGELCARLGMALVFITHDLGLVSQTCSRLVTMYAGEVVEEGRVDDILVRPRHPYSSGLLRSLPALTRRKAALPAIPGRVPQQGEMPDGCRFRPRCGHARPACLTPQALRDAGSSGGRTRCCRAEELALPGVLTAEHAA
ncbi:dipeptide ABC transporter ATP binding subunit DppD [Rhodovastum atsumiense]|uniref:ABC transporter ATP-binding protein n=1 Tax=Rhodovastum atsumiense TaxID=504468 RepID=A0A5M6J1E5_9PROT|nr:ABC transporter ATP-binding protein [Rhodovastum atsumiense]KAA5613455.1 ABC transporter ATP-binding protein [Rhodovastum atsumiense]CAH2603190.1 dipeptide ABC transporter ATP binding subunit DppD [Rhodovastum atsumiense]